MGMESGPEKHTKSLDSGFKDPKILAQTVLAQKVSGHTDHRLAMKYWLNEDDGSSFATRFSKYVEDHPDVSLDVDNEDAMQRLVDAIQTRH